MFLILRHTSFPQRERRIPFDGRINPPFKGKRHRSRDAVGIRGVRQAARKRREASAFERSFSEAGGGVWPFIPIQARKAGLLRSIQGTPLLSKDSLHTRICGDKSGLYKFTVFHRRRPALVHTKRFAKPRGPRPICLSMIMILRDCCHAATFP
jgi:hypothetical protein